MCITNRTRRRRELGLVCWNNAIMDNKSLSQVKIMFDFRLRAVQSFSYDYLLLFIRSTTFTSGKVQNKHKCNKTKSHKNQYLYFTRIYPEKMPFTSVMPGSSEENQLLNCNVHLEVSFENNAILFLCSVFELSNSDSLHVNEITLKKTSSSAHS